MRGRNSIFAVHYFFRCAPHVFSFSVSSVSMSLKDVVARRRPLVQSIRQAGGRCFIRGMPDDAGRKRVESFVHRVLESAGPAKAKSLARASLTAYLATFQDSPAGTGSKKSKKSTAAPSTSTPKPRRVRGKSQLFTYNWDFLASNLPDGTPPARDAAHLWNMWQSWEAELRCDCVYTDALQSLNRVCFLIVTVVCTSIGRWTSSIP